MVQWKPGFPSSTTQAGHSATEEVHSSDCTTKHVRSCTGVLRTKYEAANVDCIVARFWFLRYYEVESRLPTLFQYYSFFPPSLLVYWLGLVPRYRLEMRYNGVPLACYLFMTGKDLSATNHEERFGWEKKVRSTRKCNILHTKYR